ncbi:MAG: selenocysteine-specific translation elongation factor [Candidatus Sulfotelmatobacter sp.]
MKSIVVGTAGHIDHGKTALVKALTGIDADRLQEEKRRGITIDLGFAHLDLPMPNGDTLRVGFIDVPGHERFVRNMLAGVGGIDLALLVIAADEGIKPQTREHFDILQLLGVQRGIIVLTKSDTVDAETLAVVRLEVEEFLRGTFLGASQSPVIAVSSLTGDGIDRLKQAIVARAADLKDRDSTAIARLPIDRVFTMKGFGTVVTGTLVSGTVLREDELEVFPGERRVRVRGVQVHGQPNERTIAGQRTALNLAAVSTGDLARGMTLASPGLLAATRRTDVLLKLLPSAARSLKNRARAHFHSYAMETVVEMVLHGAKHIDPGEEALARFKFPEAALILPGDRFILRQFSPVATIGGGTVLDAAPIPRMPGVVDFLTVLSKNNAAATLTARIARRGSRGASIASLIAETGWTRSVVESRLKELVNKGDAAGFGEIFLQSPALEALKSRIVGVVGDFHKKNPLVGGVNKEELRSVVDVSSEVFEGVTTRLISEKKIEIAGDLVHLPGRGVLLRDDEAESRNKIEEAFASTGLKVPALADVLAALKIDKARAQKIVTILLRDRVLVKISDDLVFHRGALDQLRRQMKAHKAKSPTIDVTQFKELTGASRKYAIPLLEYLDRERVTKRMGNVREIL